MSEVLIGRYFFSFVFFFSSRRRHTRYWRDWSSDVCSSDLALLTSRSLLAQSAKPKPMRILILGGTGFTGPFQVEYAVKRGHKVTVFNRGKTKRGELPEGVEQLVGDRNNDLESLKGKKWDVVIDNPTSVPVWVRDAAQVLKGNVDRYVFISTISVYADNAKQK